MFVGPAFPAAARPAGLVAGKPSGTLYRRLVRHLDLREIDDCYERKDGRGLAAYHPEMLTRLLLYGYSIGECSSRRIEQATYDDLAFRYLAADQHPDHDTNRQHKTRSQREQAQVDELRKTD